MSWTRRQFLDMVGMLGGSAAVHEVMAAMGWLNVDASWDGPPKLTPDSGRGKKVLILGAGIGGLTAAYELQRAGYEVLILEPQQRAGGRNHTARRGTKIVEQSDERGVTTQTCDFDEGLYLNLGPGRLPYHYRRCLHYCKVLGVPLEVYNMTTTANLWQRNDAFKGKQQIRRALQTDAQGYIAELLAKQVCKGSLNTVLTTQEMRNCMLDLLVTFGDLGAGVTCSPKGVQTTKDCWPTASTDSPKCEANDCKNPKHYTYCGSVNAGCAELNIHTPCVPPAPIPLGELLQSQFWAGAQGSFYQPLVFEWQPTLFQPIGGMDQIVEGFLRQVGTLIAYRSEVTGLKLDDNGVEVEYLDQYSRKKGVLRADYCLSNIPLPILKNIPANFAPDFKSAVDRGCFTPTCKVGWQANERFWENNENQIYGGISYIEALITQIWYPSNGYFEQKGTMTGAYNYPPQSITFGNLTPPERLRVAREEASRLHPQFKDEKIVDKGISIAWQNIPYQRGGWVNWDDSDPADAKAYQRLLCPDRRFHVVGDQVSTLPGWQEGAMMSAEHVVEQIAGIRPITCPQILHAPNTRKLIRGIL